MKVTHEGLSLWYGTPDAPAPLDEIVARHDASLVVGVHPANPTNAVHVRHRVDGGIVQSAAGRDLRTDYAKNTQYFIVSFPSFPVGNVVEYCPIVTCAGRQAPAPDAADRFPSKFRLAANQTPPVGATSRRSQISGQRLIPELEFLAAVSVRIDAPVFIGETPEGVRIDFFVLEGTVVGPRIEGRVVPRSSDHVFVRPDGVGVLRIRAIFALNDGAMLEVEETGSVDLGPDGYQKAIANTLPSHSELVASPRILTGHPKYRWLNRLQCLAVGRTSLKDQTLYYDIFAVGSRVPPSNP